MNAKTKGAQQTVFQCHAPTAGAVFLAGTFNDWNTEAAAMRKDAQGNWSLALHLPNGRYEFKFVIDGQWCCEPGCDGTNRECPKCVPNPFGSMNRVVDVA